VQLARGFGLMTVAEGVEDALTVERLWSLGVEHAQGYHFARPSAASEVLRGSAVLPVLSSSSPRLRRVSNMKTGGLARRFGNALRVGEASAAERVVEDALTSGLAPEAVQTLVIAPAMGTIGELWEARAIGVADEHLATSISHGALARLSREMNARGARPRSREPVLLAAVEGEHHVLGLRMIADVLEGAGFDVLYLGEDVPVDSLQAFLVRHRPAVAGLTFGTANPICHLADSLWAIHEFCPDTRVMLGGRAVPPRLREADYPYVANSMEVLRVIEALLAGPPQRLPAIVDLVRSDWTRSQASREHVAGGKP